MKTLIKLMVAASVVGTSSIPMAAPASAHASRYRHHHYHGKTVYAYRTCRYSSGTTGLVAGGVGGAVVGSKVLGGPVGAIAGAVGGAVAGRAIDRNMTAHRRCRIVQ